MDPGQLEFLQSGKLTPAEWQKGMYRAFQNVRGPGNGKYRKISSPPWLFNKRMQDVFDVVDWDGDGLISRSDLLMYLRRYAPAPVREKPEGDWTKVTTAPPAAYMSGDAAAIREAKTKTGAHGGATHARNQAEVTIRGGGALDETGGLLQRSITFALDDVRSDSEGGGQCSSPSKKKPPVYSELLRALVALLLRKYGTFENAFKHIDVDKSRELSMAELKEGLQKKTHFAGDFRSIFKELDFDNNCLVSVNEFVRLAKVPPASDDVADKYVIKTRRDVVEERLQRSPIDRPAPLHRSLCLVDMEKRPLGANINTAAGFYSIPRLCTGRLDSKLHPNELPGFDPEIFTKERGPGYCKKGPEYFQAACCNHPLQGNKFKVGSTLNRTERFGPIMPSAQAKRDHEHSAAGFATYEGQVACDTWNISNQGSYSVQLRSQRMGPTMTNDGGMGLHPPKPIGRWGDSRVTLRCRSLSTPSLLTQVV